MKYDRLCRYAVLNSPTLTQRSCFARFYCMAGACSRYNARSDWLSARELFSLHAHEPITNYAKINKTKMYFKGQISFYFSENYWERRR